MHAVKKMATLKHPKDVVQVRAGAHGVPVHPPTHKTMSCALKMAVKKSA